MKRLFRSLYLLLILAAPHSAAVDYTPKNTIFVWDIHGVILQKDISKITKLLAHIIWEYPVFAMQQAYSYFLRRKDSVPTTVLRAARKEQNEELINLLVEVGNTQKEIEGTKQIIAAIKLMGFKNYIASNIDSGVFAQLVDPAKNPRIAPFFLANFNLEGSQAVDYDESSEKAIFKPNPAYYEKFMERNHINPRKTHIIFIDDTFPNIAPARKAGWIPIHFINAKQLIEKLNCMGIPVNIAPTNASIAAPI